MTAPTMERLTARLARLGELPDGQYTVLRSTLERQLTQALLTRLPAEQQSAFLRQLERGDAAGLERFLQRHLRDVRRMVAQAAEAALREQQAASRQG